MKSFYAEVDDIGYKILHKGPLDRDDLRRMYEKATDDAGLAEKHTQEVYKMFDSNNDGLLSRDEVIRRGGGENKLQGTDVSFGAGAARPAAPAAAAVQQQGPQEEGDPPPIQREQSARPGRLRPLPW